MAEKVTYDVMRRHEGDRLYEEGETREMTEADAKHLVPHVLQKAKAAPAPQNKAETAPANKADPLDHDKNGRRGGAVKAKG